MRTVWDPRFPFHGYHSRVWPGSDSYMLYVLQCTAISLYRSVLTDAPRRESEGSIDESKSENRQRKSTNRKATSEHRQTNIEKDTKTALTNPKLDPRRPKMTPGAHPNGVKRGRRVTKKRSPTANRAKNRTKTSTRPT